jgi:hypothetical protein
MKSLRLLTLLLTISSFGYGQSYINDVLGKYIGTVFRSACPSPITSNGSLSLVPSSNYSVTINEEDSSAACMCAEPWEIVVNADSTMLRFTAPGSGDSVAYGRLYANDSIHLFVKIFGSTFCHRIFDGFKLYSTVGVEELYLPENELVISPQPASGEMYIQSAQVLFKKEEELLIYDLNGRKLKIPISYINANTYKADVSKLNAGVYVVFVNTDTGILRKKILVGK